MKVQLNNGLAVCRVSLLNGLNKLTGAVAAKSSLAILKAVKIEATKEEIILTATDSDFTVVVTLENESDFTGFFVVEYKPLVAFLKKVKANTIQLERVENYKVNVQAERMNYKLYSHDVDSYPQVPHSEYDEIVLTTQQFKTAMNNTLYAIATSESRPVLTGVNIIQNMNGLKFVATDSHRLAQYELWENGYDGERTFVPSGELLKKAVKIIDKKSVFVKIGFTEHVTVLKFDNVTCYIRNLVGNYPDTSRLIPEDFKTEVTIDTADMLQSLDLMKVLFKGERNQLVKMDITSDKTIMEADKPETAENMSAELLTSDFNGEVLNIAFNGQYAIDALKTIEENNAVMHFSGNMRPFIIKPNNNATHLILPVRR